MYKETLAAVFVLASVAGCSTKFENPTDYVTYRHEPLVEKVQDGMSKDEVRRILGKPTQISHFALKKEDVWSWRWQEEITRQAMFNAHFAGGDVVTTTSRSETPENENR